MEEQVTITETKEEKPVKLSDNPLAQVIQCKRCKTKFDSTAHMEHFDGYTARGICPKCGYGVKVVKNVQAKGYIKDRTGQLVRTVPKVKKPKNTTKPVQLRNKVKLSRAQKRKLHAINN